MQSCLNSFEDFMKVAYLELYRSKKKTLLSSFEERAYLTVMSSKKDKTSAKRA